MKKLVFTLIVSSLVSIAAPSMAAKNGAPAPRDTAAVIKLSQIEARKSMLTLCGVTGDEAAKDLAKDNEQAASLQATLSDAGKKSLPDTLAKIDAGVQASWEKTPEDVRAKSCEALKTQMAAGK